VTLKTLILEPTYSETLECLVQTASQNGHVYVSPTPAISPFWNTTFTPSSTEIVFRGLNDKPPTDSKVYTIQPCIRINDLPNLADGWHCLLFHMVSSFVLQVENFEETLTKSLQALIQATNLNLTDFYFTVSTNPFLPNSNQGEGLGFAVLQRIGISEKNIIFNAGSDNYQNHPPHHTGDKRVVSMAGPKIEIYVRPSTNESLYEVATCLLGTGWQDGGVLGNAFAFAVGLERVSAIAEGKTSISLMQRHSELINSLTFSLLHPSMASTPLGKEAMIKLLLMVDALAEITPNILSGEKYNRGIMNHYRRVVRELTRTLKAVGTPLTNFYKALSDSFEKDMEALVNSYFLHSQIEENYSEYL
jgi:hypothetical protein